MTAARPEIGARLDHLCITSPEPQRLAAFFERVYGMQAKALDRGLIDCVAHGRRVLVAPGPAQQTRWFAYVLDDEGRLAGLREAMRARGVDLQPNPSPVLGDTAFAINDPDGNTVVFGARPDAGPDAAPLPARLQHVVYRTTRLDEMVAFYVERLGFVASDRVHDGAGVLRACFMRTDVEHHSLALFRSPETRLDHHSYETTDWEHIRRWADDFSVKRVPIFWGVGRHGPGNDLFFMVKDPDDNLVEISAEIEQCATDRPMGIWPHEERTLNVWGNAILRS